MTPTELGIVYNQLFTHREIHGNPPDRYLRDGEPEAVQILQNCSSGDLQDLRDFLASQGFDLVIRDGIDLGIPPRPGRSNTLYVITKKRGEPLAAYIDKGWFIERILDRRRRNATKAELVVWLSRMWLTLQWFFYQKIDRLPSEVSRYREAIVSLEMLTSILEEGIEKMGNTGRPEGEEGIVFDHLWAGKSVLSGYSSKFIDAMKEAGMIQSAGNPGEYKQTLVAAIDMATVAEDEMTYLIPPKDVNELNGRTAEMILGSIKNAEADNASHS